MGLKRGRWNVLEAGQTDWLDGPQSDTSQAKEEIFASTTNGWMPVVEPIASKLKLQNSQIYSNA